MPTLQEQLDALKAARNSGVRSVTYSDRTVVYVDPKDMDDAIAKLEREIAGSSATPRYSRASFSRE